jgi:hypothetical protein
MAQRPRIILDTSAINKLADDPEFGVLFAGIKTAFFVRVTETNIAEVVATKESEERVRILQVLRTLTTEGECIHAFHVLIEGLVRLFEKNPTGFDWRRLPVRFRQAEHEIVRQKITTDELANVQREQLRTLQIGFQDIYAKMRPSFDAIFQDKGSLRRERLAAKPRRDAVT